ncbi:MAG: phosphomannomutase/phosphoglucomutase [Christensenellales bacterium]
MARFDPLKSGTDLRGLAMGEGAQLTPDVARRIGRAFACWVKQRIKGEPGLIKVAIGRDSRLSGPMLLEACAAGLAKQGVHVLDLGLCTTPAMYESLVGERPIAQASIMVTASHHPSDRNGFKFFTPEGGISARQLDELVRLMETEMPAAEKPGSIAPFGYLDLYKAKLIRLVKEKLHDDVPRPLLGIHILVDAGNGAGGFYAAMLDELGAWTEGSQFLDPDGRFPNHIPNPEDPQAIDALCQAVVKYGADLGVMFDADCDRAALVDQSGLAINRNRLIALTAAMLLNVEPGLTIVTDSVTSSGLSKFIGEWGGEHYRFKRGYRNVIDEAKRLNQAGVNCPLAIETSGHAALRENGFLDDGMYLSTLLICEAMRLKREGGTLTGLLEGLQEPLESVELRLGIQTEDFHASGRAMIEAVMDHASEAKGWHVAPDNREGIRINFDLEHGRENAWFLLRLSVHDPVLPLNAESDVRGGVRTMLRALHDVIKDTPGVDMTPLLDYLQAP